MLVVAMEEAEKDAVRRVSTKSQLEAEEVEKMVTETLARAQDR